MTLEFVRTVTEAFCFVLAATSCAAPAFLAATPTAVNIPTQRGTLTSTPASGLPTTAPHSPTPALQTPGIQARVVSRCSIETGNGISNLDLPEDWALLLSAESEGDFRNWESLGPGGEAAALDVAGYPSASWLEFRGVSPSHRLIALYAYFEDTDLIDLWVASPGNGMAWRVAEGFDRPYVLEWLSDEVLAVFDGGTPRWYTTWILVDVATGARRQLPEVWLELAHAFSPDGSQLIYLSPVRGGREVHLYDFEEGTDNRILPWLDPGRIQIASNIWMQWTTAGVTVALVDGARITVAPNVPVGGLATDTGVVRTLVFPREATRSFSYWFSNDGRWIALWRGYGGYFMFPDTQWEFLVLDTTEWILYDYCLPTQWLSPATISGSPDGSFVSLTSLGVGSVVLDLTTGARAYLPSRYVWGWVVTSP